MKPRQKRFAIVVGGLAALGIAAALVLNAFQSNLVFFFTPTQVAAGEAPKGRAFRIGGLVKEGSLERTDITARFVVTDTAKEIPVTYKGILPDLFSEGKGADFGDHGFSGEEMGVRGEAVTRRIGGERGLRPASSLLTLHSSLL